MDYARISVDLYHCGLLSVIYINLIHLNINYEVKKRKETFVHVDDLIKITHEYLHLR